MAENNSISTLLPQLLRLFNNSLEGFEKVNEAITSSRESVTIDVQNEDGTVQRLTIPSFGFLKNSIDRLNQNFQTLSNVGGGDSSVRLSDGTFRKVVLAKLPSEASDITSLNSVNEFSVKPNWFFEELINPLLYVKFDITNQAPITTEQAIVRRYILDTASQSQINYFNSELNGRNDISFDDFLQNIVERNISYVLDEAVVDIPPREKRYSGNFSVIRISTVDVTEEVNGISVTTQKKLYKLNKINYTDTAAEFPDTISLKVGDSLDVVSDPVDTRYIVKQIDSSTNSVVLELVEGSKGIPIGADVLKIGANQSNQLFVDVTIGFNERCVTFIKTIDPNSRIPAVNWSPGSAFFTSDLITINSEGTQQTLAEFYKDTALDFGRYLLSFAKDKYITTAEGVTPNAPALSTSDFSVKLINSQLTNSNAVVQLQDLNNQKLALESSIKELDSAIAKKKTKIQTTNYATEVERDADKNALQGLITDRSTQSELYSSVVKEIDAKGKDSSVASILPKYRVRGFWPLPEEKSTPETGPQKIVKFIVRYRYLSEDGAANPVDQFTYTDGTGQSQGAFSNYVEVESVVRPRIKNNITGKYEWAPINDSDANAININQLDIPISKGEQVEIQVKTVSEAGWPSNPLESIYSAPVRISFPANLSSDSVVESILEQNREDLAKVNLESDLNAKGIDQHLASSFIANSNYFAHSASFIASGFLSDNQTPIDLFTKLSQIQAQLNEFNEILKRASGELVVNLVDDLGNVIKLARNSVTKVFAGFYSQQVKDLDDPRGAIISKTYFVNLANSNQTGLQLIARVSGSRGRMVKQSENPSASVTDIESGSIILPATYSWLNNSFAFQSDQRQTYNTNDSDYNTIRKYDLSPISLSNPDISTTESRYGQIKSFPPFQSVQNKNQFIYCRFKDVSSEEVFYSYINPDLDESITSSVRYTVNLDTAENFYTRNSQQTASSGFIWGGGFDSSGLPTLAIGYELPANDQTVDIQITHPFLQNYAAYRNAYIALTGDTTTLPTAIGAGVDCTSSGNGTAAVLFRHSKFAPLTIDKVKGKQQAIYLNENVIDLLSLSSATPISFTFNGIGTGQSLQASPSLIAISNLSSLGVNYGRNVKNSFDTFDQYLLGKQSCGSYLFLSSDDHRNIQVDGDSIQSTKLIQFGSQNSINIPLVFQYRMTDYYGSGDGSSGGLGNIGGDVTGAITNLTYSKKIGIDIYPNATDVYQYDIEVSAKYRSDNLNLDVFPSASVSSSLGDLERVLNTLNPSVTETKVNQAVNTGSTSGLNIG
jgi:hypothetical protein